MLRITNTHTQTLIPKWKPFLNFTTHTVTHFRRECRLKQMKYAQFLIRTQYLVHDYLKYIYVNYMAFDGKRTYIRTYCPGRCHIHQNNSVYLRTISINAETLPKFLMDSVSSSYPHLSFVVFSHYICMCVCSCGPCILYNTYLRLGDMKLGVWTVESRREFNKRQWQSFRIYFYSSTK